MSVAGNSDCMFQYGSVREVFVDTGLITQGEALNLFRENKHDFIKRLENDENPQMAIWINCKTSQSYAETLHDWYAEDFKVVDGELYKKVDV